MMRSISRGLVILFCTGLIAAQEKSPARPERLPTGIPPTVAAMYHLLFQLERGVPYRDFAATVPNLAVAREPVSIVEACRQLGLRAKHRKANWSDLLQLEGPFLARNRAGNWLLYRARDGQLYRLDQDEPDQVAVDEADFLKSWTNDLITAATPTAEELAASPRVEFEEKEHDFGDVWQGDSVEHIFGFRNAGTDVLRITNVLASCGCTAVLVSENEIVSGATGTVKVRLNTAGKRQRTESTVSVYTNDYLNPVVVLRVKANVRVAFEVLPSQAYFGLVSKGSSLTRDIRINAVDDPAFEIRDATCSNPRIHFDLKTLEPEQGNVEGISYMLKISLDIEGAKYGQEIMDNVVLHTTSKKHPTVEIPVQATVVGDVFMAPPNLHFAPLYPNRELVRYLIVRNNGKQDLKVLEVRSDIPGLSFTTESIAPGRHFRIRALLRVGDKPEVVEGEVVVVTDHPEQTELRAPVTSSLPTRSEPGPVTE